MKVVINDCFGGFSLSQKGYDRLAELGYQSEDMDYYKTENLKQNAEKMYEDTKKYDGSSTSDDWLRIAQSMYNIDDIPRNHPLLVRVVEELGDEAAGLYAHLKIVEIPDDVKWEIDEYDGNESIHEVHRSWS